MTPARIMAEVYGRILRKMRAEGFRVFEKRYRLGTLRKAAIVSRLSLFSMLSRGA
jgi:phytoene/squalene synthetase